jgi:hypothetical protein
MPVLLRAAHVDSLPSGTSTVVKIRGQKLRIVHVGDTFAAFAADDAPMGTQATEADLVWARQKGATEFRAVVRGTFVHVALDNDRETAPASVQGNSRSPERQN